MKRITLILAILITLITVGSVKAQVRVNVNIGQPAYYYMPDHNAYYHVSERTYYYRDRGRWVHRPYMPGNYNVYNVRHIEVHESRPYLRHSYYHNKYSSDRNRSRNSYRNSYKNEKVYYKSSNKHNGNRGNGRGRGHGNHR